MAGIRLGTEDCIFKLGNSDCKVYIGDTLLYQPYSPSGQTPCFEVVDALSGASGDYVDVYNTSDSKWYKKNNLNQYEEYGIMPTVDALSGVTYYVGKLVVLSTDNHEYKWNGTDWVDIGDVVTSGTSEYFLAESTSSESAIYRPGYYFGDGYHVELDVSFTTYNSIALLGCNSPETAPVEFTTYRNGFFNDFHAPLSTTDNSCYAGDYSKRNIITSMGISPLVNRRFRIRVGICDVTWYDYETGQQLYRRGTKYTGYNWYNGLYSGQIRCDSGYTVRYKGFKVYDANENLVNDIEARYRPGTTADKQIYFHDNVLNVDYENETENPVGYYEEQGEQVTVYPEDYQTKVAPPDNVVYSTLAELELMECPWVGMHATVGGVLYIYTVDGWESTGEEGPCFEVVDVLSAATGNYVDVYNSANNKWYKKNNLNQYEEYGLMPTVDALSGVTYYVGKLVVLSTDKHEYKWNGSSWTDLGAISYAYTEYEYVQGNGTSRIVTDYYANDSSWAEVDIEGRKASSSTSRNGESHPFGSYHDISGEGTTKRFKWLYPGSGTQGTGGIRFDYKGTAVQNNSSNLIINRGVVKLTSEGGYINDTKLISFPDQSSTSLSGNMCPVGIFQNLLWNGTSVIPQSGSIVYDGKIYSVKMYEGETLVRNFVPAEKDGVYGMYETVTGTMYGSVNSTPFTVGGNSTEHGSVPVEDYDTKVAPPDNVEYQTLEELELMECPWIGMHATVSGVAYIYTANGWEVAS